MRKIKKMKLKKQYGTCVNSGKSVYGKPVLIATKSNVLEYVTKMGWNMLALFVMIFLIMNLASALDLQNSKIELLESPQCLSKCYAIFNITTYQNMKLPYDLYFEDLDGKTYNLNYKLFIQKDKEVITPKYSENCIDVNDKGNITTQCSYSLNGTNSKIETYWYQINSDLVWLKGNYILKVETDNKPINKPIDLYFAFDNYNAQQIKSNFVWWSGNWSYKKPITITGNVPTNYSLKVEILNTSNNLGNGGDFRFINSSETGELGYWLYKQNATTFTFYVMVQDNNTIYAYYGNPSSSTSSNIEQAFLFGDDFNQSLDTTNDWLSVIQSGNVYVSNNSLYITNNGITTNNNGLVTLRNFSTGTVSEIDYTIINVSSGAFTGFFYGMSSSLTASDYFYANWDSKVITLQERQWGASGEAYIVSKGVYTPLSNPRLTTSSSYNTSLYFTATNNRTWYRDGTHTNENSSTSDDTYTRLHLLTLSGSNNLFNVSVENIRVRKYLFPEATASVGAEAVGSSITLNSTFPANNTFYNNTNTITFLCNFTASDTNITSVNLTIFNTSSFYYGNTKNNLNATSYNASWSVSIVNNNYTWNCSAFGLGASAVSNTFLLSVNVTSTTPVRNSVFDFDFTDTLTVVLFIFFYLIAIGLFFMGMELFSSLFLLFLSYIMFYNGINLILVIISLVLAILSGITGYNRGKK